MSLWTQPTKGLRGDVVMVGRHGIKIILSINGSNQMNLISHTFLLLVMVTAVTGRADDVVVPQWPSFRNGGSSRVADVLPFTWSSSQGIAWQVETDGYGQSAPIIVDDTVYLTSVIGPMKQECVVTAFSLSSGESLWQQRIQAAATAPSNYMNSRGAPTPVADETGVYAFFESGDLLAVKRNGEQVWHRNFTKDLGPFQSRHGLGSSLAQSDDLLFLNLEHKGPSRLVAVRKSDGYIAWQVDRPSGSSWTSPVVTEESVIVSSARSLTAYDLASGKQQWAVTGLDGNTVPSPCVLGDRVFTGARIPEFGAASDAAKSNLCVRIVPESSQVDSSAKTGVQNQQSAGAALKGALKAEVVWRSQGAVCDYASPVVSDGRVYYLNKVGVLSCLDADTGKQLYRSRLSAECWATPIVADNGIYFFAKDGTTKVIARGTEFRVLQTNQLWDPNNPPVPESYRESKGSGHGHGGGHSAQHGSKHGSDQSKKVAQGSRHENPGDGELTGKAKEATPQRASGGMIGAMMKGDVNGDGILQATEISADFRPLLKRIDTNGDGSLDQKELEAMAKSFAERRKNSQASSRDPIVYGVAAVPGMIVVRTGTRLYCIAGTRSISETENSP